MTELIMVLDPSKSDIVNALKMKSQLWDKGIVLSGILLTNDDGEVFSPELLEDMMQLRVLGSLKKR